MRRIAAKASGNLARTSGGGTVLTCSSAWLLAALLVLGTIAVYWPATLCDFVNYDDDLNLTANVHVQSKLSWEGIQWAFGNPLHTLWTPLTALSHTVVWQLCGLNPWGHHLANVLLHALNAALVFLLFQRMTGAGWRSLWVAALFAVHPLRVEAVVWVTERREVLSSFFGLLALMAYARYVEVLSLKSRVQSPKSVVRPPSAVLLRRTGGQRSAVGSRWSLSHLPSSIFYLLSLFFFALGLMSKPILVTWPFLMLLLDYWPLQRLQLNTQNSKPKTLPSLLLEKLPFFALAALASVVAFLMQNRGGALMMSLPLDARLGNAMISYGRYLGKLFWPRDLAAFYPHPGQWPLGQVVLAGGLLMGSSVLFWVRRRQYPYLLLGWLWYCGTLVPVSQVIQMGTHAMADRWSYIPSLGVLTVVVWGACEMNLRWRHPMLAWSVAGGAAIILCLALTRQQIGYWKDSETLFRHALAVTENNSLAHNNLGAALGRKGQSDEAIRQFQEALRLAPGYALAHNNLGDALDKRGQTDAAISQFQEALRLDPGHAMAHNNLGYALGQKGQLEEANWTRPSANTRKPSA
jgi:protein O-mannosyl-transferase